MTDRFTPAKRSEIMSEIKGRDTGPEKEIRRLLHRLGYRFRLQRKELPGKPDIVLPKYRTVIFMHGCFWHGHVECLRSKRPTTNIEFWNKKIDANIRRDIEAGSQLEKMGWRVFTVWQCQIKDTDKLIDRLIGFIEQR
jgi:DNA mismatch endonuclease, patch repair protein